MLNMHMKFARKEDKLTLLLHMSDANKFYRRICTYNLFQTQNQKSIENKTIFDVNSTQK